MMEAVAQVDQFSYLFFPADHVAEFVRGYRAIISAPKPYGLIGRNSCAVPTVEADPAL